MLSIWAQDDTLHTIPVILVSAGLDLAIIAKTTTSMVRASCQAV
jgi:hypothetical protein